VVNIAQNKELVGLAKPFPCTFHRAFDEVSDVFQSLEDIIECGFTTVLTSGQTQNVTAGIDNLTELVKKTNNRITIMPGGGLRSSNIGLVQQKTKATFYHSSAITDGSPTANTNEITALKNNLK
jgi:copper homeostasis protein